MKAATDTRRFTTEDPTYHPPRGISAVRLKHILRQLEPDRDNLRHDRSGANTAGISVVNRMLRCFGCPIPIEMVRIKYLNNMVEQDHRTIKKRTRPMSGFKSFVSASATLEGIEVANMIRKGQMALGLCPFAQFASLGA